jgi:hypothetical protein
MSGMARQGAEASAKRRGISIYRIRRAVLQSRPDARVQTWGTGDPPVQMLWGSERTGPHEDSRR